MLFFLCFAPSIAAEKKDAWTEVRSPNFLVISTGGEKLGRSTADQFETFRGVFSQLFPKARVDLGKPLIILAVRNEKELKQLLPEYWERKGSVHPAGIFVPGQEKLYVALRSDVEGEFPFSLIYHEYVHALMQLNFENLPLWLNEGIAEFYAQAFFTNKEVTLGRPSSYHLFNLSQQKLLPLEVLLAADRNSPHYNEANKASVFYSQSWALTHFLFFDKAARDGQWLVQFLTKTANGVPPMEAAQQVFGDLKVFGKRFDGYIRQQVFSGYKAKPNTVIDEKTFPARTLTLAESAAQVGDFHVHMDRPAEAKAQLDEALQLDPKSALAHESYGTFYLRQQNWTEAAKWYEKAVSLDSRSFLAHYHAAMLVVQRGGFSGEIEKTEALLRRAIELNPGFAPAYSTLATLYAANDEKLEEALTFARKAVALEPGFLLHRLNVAQVLLRMKRVDEAIVLGNRVLSAAADPGERMMVQAFLESAQNYKASLARYEAAKKEEEAYIRAREAERAEWEAAEKKRAEAAAARVAGAQLKPGEVSVYGTITQATCSAPQSLQLKVLLGSATMTVRAARRESVEYQIGPGRPLRFDPCRDLQGQQAEVIYRAAKLRTQPGDLVRVLLLDNPVQVGPAPAPPSITASSKARTVTPSAASDGTSNAAAPLPSGPPGWSEGNVSVAACSGAELHITVDVGGGFSTRLRAANYHRVEFLAAAAATLPDNFQPCTQLRGRTVEVKYVVVTGKPYEGEILSIQIQR